MMLATVERLRTAEDEHMDTLFLPSPRTVKDAGLDFLFLVELHAKLLMLRGECGLRQISEHVKLPVTLVDNVLSFMRTEKLCEVKRRGVTDGEVYYVLTENGRIRAAEFLQKSQYAGAAPVSLAAYSEQVRKQGIAGMTVRLEDVERAFQGLAIRNELREQFGAAMNSGRAMFIYGPPGSGKTYLAEQLLHLLNGRVAVPYAICIENEVIQVFDPLVHEPIEEVNEARCDLDRRRTVDSRWVVCRRPVSISGGELTMDMLNLHFDATARFYQAPPHVKANNGLYIIDDLGRQLVSPQQLMNRWIVPMDRHVDYQALHTGYKFAIPFDVILVFSTNLAPSQVADEAFLRRLGYKIHVGPLAEPDYRAVFSKVCEQYGVPRSDAAYEYLLRDLHGKHGRPLLACYPRDIVGQIRDFSLYRGLAPELTREALEWAWANYFASH